jgi:hypothetical protein
MTRFFAQCFPKKSFLLPLLVSGLALLHLTSRSKMSDNKYQLSLFVGLSLLGLLLYKAYLEYAEDFK